MNTRVRRVQLGTWYAVGLLLVEAMVACGGDEKKDTPANSAGKGGTSSAGKGGSSNGGKGGTARGGSSGKGSSGDSGTAGGTSSVGGSGAVGGDGGNGMMTNPRCQVLYDFSINTGDASVPYSTPSKLREDVDFEQTSDEGAGTPGALEVTIPFNAEDQLAGVSLTPYEYKLTGLSLTARVKLGAGLTSDESHPGRARLAVKAGLNLVPATGPDVELVEGEWLTLRFDPWKPEHVDDDGGEETYDPTSVFDIAVEILSGENADTKYTEATVFIDDLSICKSSTVPPMGGTGGGGKGGTGGTGTAAGEGGLSGSGTGGTLSGGGGEAGS